MFAVHHSQGLPGCNEINLKYRSICGTGGITSYLLTRTSLGSGCYGRRLKKFSVAASFELIYCEVVP